MCMRVYENQCKLKYEDSENIKTDHISTVVFNLHQIKRRALFLGTPGICQNLSGFINT